MGGKMILLGVTGGIAAYKSAMLCSHLVQAGYEVQTVMSENATKLVGSRTFATLSHRPVVDSLWDTPDWRPEHVALAEAASLLVVAPATANFIGKYANGIADDALTTLAIAFPGPVVLAPAMNPRMWEHPAVRHNVQILRERGVRLVGPAAGHVACGLPGEGRMSEPDEIFSAVTALLPLNKLIGE